MPEMVCLDDSSFSREMENALKKREEYTTQWKYTKESDMGVTLLELMAVMTELQGYHADSVTEAHLRRYAMLLSAGTRGQKCAKIAFKSMETKKEALSPARVLRAGTPLLVDGHVFEYSGTTEKGYAFIQKDTKTDFREFNITGGVGRAVRLTSYQARQSALDGALRVYEFEGGASWVRSPDCFVRITDAAVELSLKPGRFRIVYGPYAKPVGTASGTASQELALPYKNPLPQALRLWAKDGSSMRDIGYTLKGQSVVLGNGADFPILPAGAEIYPCRLVLSDGEVRVSRKNTVRQAKNVVFSLLEVINSGASLESAENSIKRLSKNGTLCAVTDEDYRLRASEITGLAPEDIMVESRVGAVDIVFFAPVPNIDEARRRLGIHKPLGVLLRVESAVKIPVKLRGEIDLYEDHPENRREAAKALADALKAYYRQPNGGDIPVNIMLQKTLSGMNIVRRARVEAFVSARGETGAFMPEPDMEEITYV